MLATVSMITGFVLARGGVSWYLLPMIAGVFLIACGSATINQIQERRIDGLMRRTMGRPLPSGRIGPGYAWVVVLLALSIGSGLILLGSNPMALALGLFAVFWYNAVYTPLKRVTAFAAVPGGVVGAIPPIIGWVAGGGDVLDPRILAVAFFFFIWQVPHFWLLLVYACGADYERAGLPSLTRMFTIEQLGRITFVWILATAVTCLVMPLFGMISNPFFNLGLVLAGAWLVWGAIDILKPRWKVFGSRVVFRQINLYIFWVIALLSANGIVA